MVKTTVRFIRQLPKQVHTVQIVAAGEPSHYIDPPPFLRNSAYEFEGKGGCSGQKRPDDDGQVGKYEQKIKLTAMS